MKVLLTLFFLSPLLVRGQEYFGCDHKKIAKIINSNTGIVKASKSKYTIAGKVQLEIWNIRYDCDSAIFDCKRNELAIYGNINEVPAPRVHIRHCDEIIFSLSYETLVIPCDPR